MPALFSPFWFSHDDTDYYGSDGNGKHQHFHYSFGRSSGHSYTGNDGRDDLGQYRY